MKRVLVLLAILTASITANAQTVYIGDVALCMRKSPGYTYNGKYYPEVTEIVFNTHEDEDKFRDRVSSYIADNLEEVYSSDCFKAYSKGSDLYLVPTPEMAEFYKQERVYRMDIAFFAFTDKEEMMEKAHIEEGVYEFEKWIKEVKDEKEQQKKEQAMRLSF